MVPAFLPDPGNFPGRTSGCELKAEALSKTIQFAKKLPRQARVIIAEELEILKQLREHLHLREETWSSANYDSELIELRDSLGDAQDDDVAQIVHQMANLASISSHRQQREEEGVPLDTESPYFGHLCVEQGGRKRDILIGNRTVAGNGMPFAIIDWRHAPISKVFYLYREEDEYEEEFGGKLVEGKILAHRKLMILEGHLLRIECTQGIFALIGGEWSMVQTQRPAMTGGAGAAMRPESVEPLAATATEATEAAGAPRMGVQHSDIQHSDKRLSAITGLIDPAQFELITQPDSGLVVIDGGAGSGKTTIGLHRIAYLAYRDPVRFRPERMLVVVFGKALAYYISRLLPALGVEGVRVEAAEDFFSDLRRRHFPKLPVEYEEATPAAVIRFKQHPSVLAYLEELVEGRAAEIGAALIDAAADTPSAGRVREAWEAYSGQPPARRLTAFANWVRGKEVAPRVGAFGDDWVARQRLGNLLADRYPELDDPASMPFTIWQEAFLRLDPLREVMGRLAPGEFSAGQLEEVRNWAFEAYSAYEEYRAWQSAQKERGDPVEDPEEHPQAGENGPPAPPPPSFDREDDTLLLLLYNLTVAPLKSRRRKPLRFTHLMVDEAQDFSPLDLRVLLGLAADPLSVTLSGDTDQRMVIHNSFTRWEDVIGRLGLESTEVSPLQVGYRSTGAIMAFAKEVLGPLATERPWMPTRDGVPVELLRFTDAGQAVAVLSEELVSLARREPTANVALIARYPAQADLYHDGLKRADVPGLHRVADQNFSFRPGIEVTDVTQVKGLEFDYAILLDVDAAAYPDDDAARYLLHIGATRAAHQLFLVCSRTPSPLIPSNIRVHLL